MNQIGWKYCRCGSVWNPEMAGDLRQLRADWVRRHTGEGHGPTDSQTAAQSRRRERRALERARAQGAA